MESLQAELEESKNRSRQRNYPGNSPSPIKRVTITDSSPTIHG